jgi:hypothetical protein
MPATGPALSIAAGHECARPIADRMIARGRFRPDIHVRAVFGSIIRIDPRRHLR